MSQVITDVACTACGCVCDDLTIAVDDGRIVRAEGACSIAEPWLLRQTSDTSAQAEVQSQPVTFEFAVERSTEILRSAKHLLIYGLSRSTTEGQREATALADRLGATIDTTASTGHAPSILALQQVGESTCSLGEVKARADLVIFWGSNPVVTHPRHLERYSLDPASRFLPDGRKDRSLVVVDSEETETARLADSFLKVETGRDWDVLWALRQLVRNLPVSETDTHVPPMEKLRALAERMKSCKFGVIFFGGGLVKQRNAHRTIEALLQLVTDLNSHTRFYARRMRRFGDVAGADSVLAWQTGYPFGVNFGRGYPRYNPGEFTGPELLARQEVDACLLIGSDTIADFPEVARQHLQRIPVVLLDSPGNLSPISPAVKFTTAVYGIHRPGTAYRMDEVPIPLRVLLPTTLPSDRDVLAAIHERITSCESVPTTTAT